MALLYVTEFVTAGRYGGGVVPSADAGSWVENGMSPITIAASPAQSAPFGPNTTLVRVHADSICSVLISVTGTHATTSNARWAASQTEYFYVRPGQILSVIANV